jgi:undecaprenyl-phosphate 4-deoxy-4-formamido-L-arabinose transferase
MSYEIVFIDDGSRATARPRILARSSSPGARMSPGWCFNGNFGQHMAMHRRLRSAAAAKRIVTLDADLQNPPEEIVSLLTGRRCARATTTSARSAGNARTAGSAATPRVP